ncbi:MAG: hypothetical protein ACXVQU_08015 [Actinomycetota bacterium]
MELGGFAEPNCDVWLLPPDDRLEDVDVVDEVEDDAATVCATASPAITLVRPRRPATLPTNTRVRARAAG